MTTGKKILFSIVYATIFYFAILNVDLVKSSNISDHSICPGRKYQCDDTQTCCLTGKDKFGCCPYADATCCDDKRSCCPNGFECNTTAQTCTKKQEKKIRQPFVLIETAETNLNTTLLSDEEFEMGDIQVQNGKKTCPDGKQSCPESYTCCAQSTGGYGCCPLTGGICCEDKVHCCPMGTRCSTKLGSCDG